MESGNHITDEEIRDAIALANKRWGLERERTPVQMSNDTFGDYVGVLAQAVLEVRARTQRPQSIPFRLMSVVVVSVIALAVLGYSIFKSQRQPPVTVRVASTQQQANELRTVPATTPGVIFPPIGDRFLSGLRVAPGQIPAIGLLNIANSPTLGNMGALPLSDGDDGTSVTFINKRNSPVVLYWQAYPGPYLPYVLLRPGQLTWVPAVWGDSIVATEASGAFIAMYYPPSIPTQAVITQTTGTAHDGPLHGYSLLSSAKDVQTRTESTPQLTPHEQADSISATLSSFVNLSSRPINLYYAGRNGIAGFIENLPPGGSFGGASNPVGSYPVTDEHQHSLGAFTDTTVDRIAVVLPENR